MPEPAAKSSTWRPRARLDGEAVAERRRGLDAARSGCAAAMIASASGEPRLSSSSPVPSAARRVAEREVARLVAGRVQLDDLPGPRVRGGERAEVEPDAAQRVGLVPGVGDAHRVVRRVDHLTLAHGSSTRQSPSTSTQLSVSRSCAGPRTSTVARSPERVSTS